MNIFYTGAPPHNKRKYELGYTPVYGTVDVPQFKYVLGLGNAKVPGERKGVCHQISG
jgi:hypothetical protein